MSRSRKQIFSSTNLQLEKHVEGIKLVIMLTVREGQILHLETVKPTVSPDSWIGEPDPPVLDVGGEPVHSIHLAARSPDLRHGQAREKRGLRKSPLIRSALYPNIHDGHVPHPHLLKLLPDDLNLTREVKPAPPYLENISLLRLGVDPQSRDSGIICRRRLADRRVHPHDVYQIRQPPLELRGQWIIIVQPLLFEQESLKRHRIIQISARDVEKMKETKPKKNSRISKDARATRVVNLKMLGLTEAQISKTMENEGYKHVSTRTISRLLNSIDAQAIRDELLRRQLRDIDSADIKTRLKYRDKILSKLLKPKKK